MRIKATSTFLKQLAAVPDGVRERVEKFTLYDLPEMESLNGAVKVKKLQGYKNCYRVRFGDYRLGIEVENDVAVLRVVLHRRNIYRQFP
jgi:mRNA interferase RelE/StbE